MYRILTVSKLSKVRQYRIVEDIEALEAWIKANPGYTVEWWTKLDNGEPAGKVV